MQVVGKTAVLFGPTGAVGKEVLHLLISDHRYERVVAFSRKVLPVEHPKLTVVLDALSDLEKLADKITGHDLFCCLGTTSRKAGNRDAYRQVDLEMPAKLAEIASRNNFEGFITISSIGAGKMGRGFYLDLKTEMEDRVIQHEFKRLAIVRPSLLIARREEFRFAEEAGKVFNSLTGWAMTGRLEKFKGISVRDVARAMIGIMNTDQPKVIWESDELRSF